jgi:two-component system sensor histidine kinase ChvG
MGFTERFPLRLFPRSRRETAEPEDPGNPRLQEHVRALEAFATDLAHELKNPLASIRTAVEMLAEVKGAEERQRFVRIILEEVARMESQLSEVAEITRIGARLPAEHQEPVPVNGLLEQIAERFRMRETGLRFVVEQPAEIVTVRASAARLTQVFENIVENAASFSPAGSSVRVSLSRSGAGEAVIRVKDEGPGIPDAHRARIFDRFFSYRPEEGRRSGRPHAGLGLAIAKTIVEGYGGGIDAANNPEGGATFTVRLPASRTGTFARAPGS